MFLNSGIRAMVFIRKIGFKLHVMRLNRVELFYTLIVAIGSESRHCLRGRGGHIHVVCMQRWLAMARPPVGVGRPTVGMAGYGQPARASRQWPACKGLSPATSPTASRGGGAGRSGGCLLVGRLPTAKGKCRLHKGSDDGAVRVKEG
ncbi:hypothetical protein BHM03_00050778 [Ensete ventricosum]|nr:hypothetical protein BHM03_00050778 [Ensete ventricosum]